MQLEILGAELTPSETVCGGWIHAFGMYYPRRRMFEHQQSSWSKAVILAKRKSASVINCFGRMIAAHLEHCLADGSNYIITHVPAEPDQQPYLFCGFPACATECLAAAVYANLSGRTNITLESLLIQVMPKAKKQHQCQNDAERKKNVSGIYAVKDSSQITGRNIIIVDDVLTSGATMNECADVLRDAGAVGIIGVALARTVRLRPPIS